MLPYAKRPPFFKREKKRKDTQNILSPIENVESKGSTVAPACIQHARRFKIMAISDWFREAVEAIQHRGNHCFCWPGSSSRETGHRISTRGVTWLDETIISDEDDVILERDDVPNDPVLISKHDDVRSTTSKKDDILATETTSATLPIPELPTQIVVSMIAPFLNDRTTLNNLSVTCKDVYKACQEEILQPPWPNKLWNLHSRLWSCRFSPDGQLLAVGGTDGRIRILDRKYGHIRTLEGHLGRVYAMIFTRDSEIFMSLSGDGDLRIWRVPAQGGEEAFALQSSISTHTTHAICLAYDSHSMRLATGGEGDIKFYSIPSGIGLDVLSMEHSRFIVSSIAFSPDGIYVATGTAGRTIYIWDLAHRKTIFEFEESSSVHSLDYSSCGKYIVAGTDHAPIRLWNIQKGTYQTLQGHEDMIWCVAFSPNAKLIASASDDGTVRLWSTSTQCCLETYYGHESSYNVKFSPCGRYICSTSNDGYIGVRRLNPTILEG